jgi:hypothetical protein
MGPSLTVSPWAPSSPPLLCRRRRLSTCAGIGRIRPRPAAIGTSANSSSMIERREFITQQAFYWLADEQRETILVACSKCAIAGLRFRVTTSSPLMVRDAQPTQPSRRTECPIRPSKSRRIRSCNGNAPELPRHGMRRKIEQRLACVVILCQFGRMFQDHSPSRLQPNHDRCSSCRLQEPAFAPCLRCCAGPISCRFRAVPMRERCENACGKLPTCRCA